MVTAPLRRELVRWMQAKGMTERRALQVVGMSASAYRYQPRPDRNQHIVSALWGLPSVTGVMALG